MTQVQLKSFTDVEQTKVRTKANFSHLCSGKIMFVDRLDFRRHCLTEVGLLHFLYF